jgi:hypothetical protein
MSIPIPYVCFSSTLGIVLVDHSCYLTRRHPSKPYTPDYGDNQEHYAALIDGLSQPTLVRSNETADSNTDNRTLISQAQATERLYQGGSNTVKRKESKTNTVIDNLFNCGDVKLILTIFFKVFLIVDPGVDLWTFCTLKLFFTTILGATSIVIRSFHHWRLVVLSRTFRVNTSG